MEHESYVSLETAKLLKKAGFDWRCRKCYNGEVMFDMEPDEIREQCPQHSSYDVLAPTIDVAQRWLREVKGIHIYVKPCDIYNEQIESWSSRLFYKGNDIIVQGGAFGSYEDAQEAGIKKALELILEKGK